MGVDNGVWWNIVDNTKENIYIANKAPLKRNTEFLQVYISPDDALIEQNIECKLKDFFCE
jgi:hypothetical protein